jgi:hypothetical protein
MAKRKDIEAATGEPLKTELTKIELPAVESPSISPATPELAIEPVTEANPRVNSILNASEITVAPKATAAPAPRSHFVVRPRHKRHALLAVSVAIAAALGAVIGVGASGGFNTLRARTDVAGDDLRKAMQQSISQLAKDVTTLKTSLEAANKSAHNQVAKIPERFDRAASEEIITGSTSPPQMVAPVPAPRPAPRIAAVEIQSATRPLVIQGWTIRDARDGFVYVQGNGDIYQVVPGAPLPGLGPVESIKRQDGRWVVTTPKGIIVSTRDRRYFESF